MKRIFINRNNQLRSGWKITITVVFTMALYIVLSGLVGLGFGVISQWIAGNNDELARSLMNNNTFEYLDYIMQTLSYIIAVALAWRLFDKRPLRDLGLTGLEKGGRDLLVGLAFGALSMCFVFFFLWMIKSVVPTGVNIHTNKFYDLFFGLILYIFVGINEELFSRGYCMTVLGQTGSRIVAIVGSSILFAALHLLNPNVSLLGIINIFLVGVLFAYMYIKAGNLWLPIGYHITWNYFQGYVFGFQVSGTNAQGLIVLQETAGDLLNGGGFGPEGGFVATLAILLGFLYMWKLYKRQTFSQ